MAEIFMPKAGMDMKEGVLVRWLKQIGDPVQKDEPLMEIETDKITMEAESPAGGYVLAQYCEAGDTIPVLGIMGYIGEKDEHPPENPASEPAPVIEMVDAVMDAPAPIAQPAQAAGLRATPYARALARSRGVDLNAVHPAGKHGEITGKDVLATPLAQRIADGNGIDISALEGTGHAGKIKKADVLAVMSLPAVSGPLTVRSRTPLNGMRRVVAQRMSQSHAEIPDVTQSILVDMTDLMALRAKLNAHREQKLSVNDFVLKATAIAVKEHPKARTAIQGSEYILYAQANIGFAVSVADGLFVPVLHDADTLPLVELSVKAKDLVARARSSQLRPDECTGGVFTVSNMGMYDVWDFTPIINQPEAGILGIGAVRDMPQYAPDGGIALRKLCKICVTYDHRIFDGVSCAQFQLRVRDLLEHPEELLLA